MVDTFQYCNLQTKRCCRQVDYFGSSVILSVSISSNIDRPHGRSSLFMLVYPYEQRMHSLTSFPSNRSKHNIPLAVYQNSGKAAFPHQPHGTITVYADTSCEESVDHSGPTDSYCVLLTAPPAFARERADQSKSKNESFVRCWQ